MISALEERGFLGRRRHRARALEVLRLPENLGRARTQRPRRPARRFSPNVIRGDFTPSIPGVRAANDAAAIQLPLYGRIAAGLPIEALRDTDQLVDMPMHMLGNGEHYALEVAGDSMIEAGILDGDTVIIRRSDAAETGQIVVALVDDTEVTLKRLRRRGNSIALEPCNVRHETRIFPGRPGEGAGQAGGAAAALLSRLFQASNRSPQRAAAGAQRCGPSAL